MANGTPLALVVKARPYGVGGEAPPVRTPAAVPMCPTGQSRGEAPMKVRRVLRAGKMYTDTVGVVGGFPQHDEPRF